MPSSEASSPLDRITICKNVSTDRDKQLSSLGTGLPTATLSTSATNAETRYDWAEPRSTPVTAYIYIRRIRAISTQDRQAQVTCDTDTKTAARPRCERQSSPA